MLGGYSTRFIAILLLIVVLTPTAIYAQGALGKPIVSCNGAVEGNGLPACGICHIAKTAQNILNSGIYIGIFLSAVFFAYAGWLHVTAMGDEGKVSGAHDIFTHVGIGLVLILAAWLIVDTIMKVMINSSATFGPWNQVCALFAQHFLA